MKNLFTCFLLSVSVTTYAQNTDTLKKSDEQFLRLAGGLIKGGIKEVMAENGTPNGVKSLLGTGVKQVLTGTLRNTANSLLGSRTGLGELIQLPKVLQQNQAALIQKGKIALLNNFKQSLKDAANEALFNSVPLIIAQTVDFNIEDMIKYANADDVTITDVFKNANKSSLLKLVQPVAKSALKASGYNKKYKKLQKAFKKIDGNKLDIDSESLVSELVVNNFIAEMFIQEKKLKENQTEGVIQLFKGLIGN